MLRQIAFASLAALALLTASPARADGPHILPHPYPPPHPHHHTFRVEYRSPGWQLRAFHSWWEAREFEMRKRDQGFETYHRRHGDHVDVYYRSFHWQTYRVVYSGHEARQLERVLESRGFQVRVRRF